MSSQCIISELSTKLRDLHAHYLRSFTIKGEVLLLHSRMVLGKDLWMEDGLPRTFLELIMLVEDGLCKLKLWRYSWENNPLEWVRLDGEDPGPFLLDLRPPSLLRHLRLCNDPFSDWRLSCVAVELGELIVVDCSHRPAFIELGWLWHSNWIRWRLFKYSPRWKSILPKISFVVYLRDIFGVL